MAQRQIRSIATDSEAATPSGLYGRHSAPFEFTLHDTRGGVELEYVTGEQ